MTLPTLLSAWEALARKATPFEDGSEYAWPQVDDPTWRDADGELTATFTDGEFAFIAALNPAAVLEMIGQVRRVRDAALEEAAAMMGAWTAENKAKAIPGRDDYDAMTGAWMESNAAAQEIRALKSPPKSSLPEGV